MLDKQYIKGLKRGSHEDFTYLYNKYVANLYHFMCMLSTSNNVAKDVVQDVFLKVWNNRQDIDENKSFKSFLYTIARNEMLNQLKKSANQTLSLEEVIETPQTGSDIQERLHVNTIMDSLKIAKTKLPPRQLQLFELNKEQGLSIKEIATMTLLSEQSVRNQLSSALKILRKELGSNLLFYISFSTYVVQHML